VNLAARIETHLIAAINDLEMLDAELHYNSKREKAPEA